MARRTKPKEVIHSGDTVKDRPRAKTAAVDSGNKAGAKAMIFERGDGGYGKARDGGAISEQVSAPKRKKAAPVAKAEPDMLPIEVPGRGAAPDIVPASETRAADGTTDVLATQSPAPQSSPPTMVPSQAPAPKGEPSMISVQPAKAPAAKAKAPEPKKKPAGRSPKDRSGAMAASVVNSFVGRLKTEAQSKGGYLSVADLDSLQGEFTAQAKAITGVFEQSFDAYAEARDRAEWDKMRDLPFDRIMVKQFSHLFHETDANRFDRVTRRMLPGLFAALNMMLGEEIIEEYQDNCHVMVARLREDKGSEFDWDDVYASQESAAIILDAQVAIATHFDDFAKRRDWFIELVNGILAPADPANKDDEGWELTPAGFNRFLGAFLGSLRATIGTDAGKLQITKRHGADTTDVVFCTLENISN